MKKIMLKSGGLGIALGFLLGLISPEIQADYIYEANQSLYDLTGVTSTDLGVGDDQVSSAFNIGFTFDFYGQPFTQARMATNGCLHFKTSGAYCSDYTPDPLSGQHTYTLYPFWTDLIRDNGSKMLAKSYSNYTIFGWYNLREYNRNSTDNSFEVWLYTNDTFEFRYGALDINSHDVLIGEIGSGTTQMYTYLYFDECSTGTTNSSSCVNYNWNSSSNAANTLLESGGSLYGVGTGNALDCSSALNNAACPGYAAAYLVQQCGLNSLYSETCSGYANAYDDQQCGLDSQYAPFCAGYTTTSSVAYYDEEINYGYEDDYYDDQYGYDDTYSEDTYYEDDQYIEDYEDDQYADNCIDNPDWCYEDDPYWDQEFTDEEWYAIDLEEFGQELVDEWYGTEVDFSDEGYIEWDSSELATWDDLDEQMDQQDEYMEEPEEYYEEEYYEEEYTVNTYEEESYREETYYEDEIFLYEETYDNITHIEDPLVMEFERQLVLVEEEYWEEETEWEEFETIEELDEWYEEEFEEEFAEETFEEEFEEELLAEEAEETIEEIELELVINEEPSDRGTRSEQLNVVADSVRAATNSVSGTTSGTGSVSITYGTSSQSTGNTVASGGVSSAATGGASSGVASAGVSTTSSPSISDQFASASAQTQQVLALSPSTAVSSDISSAGTDFSSSVVSTSTISADSSVEAAETIASTDATAATSVGETVASVSSDTSTGETVASTSTDTSSSTSSTSSTEVTVTPMPSMVGQSQVAMVDVQVQGVTSEIDIATTGVMTASEADQIADKIIADNIEEQQQQVAASAEETGEYGDQTALVAYIGFNPNFSGYYSQVLPQKTDWYEPRAIYANVSISDNVSAFYDMAGTSLRTLRGMINSQPDLLGE
jgi:hypothetical protein